MARDLNKCTFIGRLGADISIKYSAGGNAIANFSIACNDDYKDKSGEEVKQTDWVNCVSFGKQAEILAQHTAKGSQLYIEGRQKTRKWQGHDGKDNWSTEINVKEFQFLGSKPKSTSPTSNQPHSNQSGGVAQSTTGDDYFDSEIPF